MKRLFLTFLCVLFAYPCFAAEPIQLARMNPWVAGSVAANSCSSGTEDQSQTAGPNSIDMISDVARGQSFKVTNTSHLYSIQVELSGGGTASDCATLRWGTSANLSSGALGTRQVCNIGVKGYVEFVLQNSTNELTSDNTYYFGLVEDSGAIILYRNEYDVYANGAYYYGTAGAAWNMSNTATYDVNFKVFVCN